MLNVRCTLFPVLVLSSGKNTPIMENELSVGQLFGRTFEVLRQNYLSVLPIFIAFGILSTALSSLISYANPFPSIPSNIGTLTSSEMSALANVVGRYIGFTLANYFLSWSILYFAAALGLWRMNQSFGLVPNQERPNYLGVAATTVFSVVIIEAGIFLLIVGALILGTMLYLVLASAVLEKRYGFAAISRSRQLVSGRWFKTFILLAGVQLMIAIVANLIGGIVGLPFSGGVATWAAVVATNFVTALSFPLVSASMLVLYYSNQAREIQTVKKPPSPYDDMRPQPIPGFPVSQRNLCSKCGSSVTQEEKFCHNCGTQLQT